MWYWQGMGWWMLFGAILMLVFWGGIIALIVWGIKKATERGASTSSGEKRSPLDITKERYARGELTKEQFEQIKKDLS